LEVVSSALFGLDKYLLLVLRAANKKMPAIEFGTVAVIFNRGERGVFPYNRWMDNLF
jgi:hypothetical protein